MIRKDASNIHIEGDSFSGRDATINIKNLGKMFSVVSKQMYRSPISSIVREITSNCFDSHIEAKVNDPVVVKLSEDEGGYYISFTDVGVGMSPERMEIYSEWFSSTKENTNDQIGTWGLGSKSPLSYTESFFLTTVYNKIRYEYCIHEGVERPRIDLLIEDTCEDRNQTEVKIYIKDRDDASKFALACQSTLLYFDNVYLESDIFLFINEYTILEYKTFKYRVDCEYSKELHIVIGKVPYPINWQEIGVARIDLPLGLKFGIGELPVTPERESIRYQEIINEDQSITQTKDIIKAKIDLFLVEIKTLFDETVDPYFDDYEQYREYIETNIAYLKLGTNKLDVTKLVEKPKAVFTPLKDFKGKLPKNLFFEYQTYFQFNKDRKSRDYKYQLTLKILRESLCVIKPLGGKYNTKKTAYLFDQAVNLVERPSFHIIDKDKEVNLNESLRILRIRINSRFYNYSQTNAVRQLKMYKDYVRSEVNRLTLNYDLLDLPADWLAKYNTDHKRNKNKGEDEILVYNYGKSVLSDGKEYINPSILEDFTGFIVYGFDTHEELLKNYRNLFINSKYGIPQLEIHPKKCRLYKMAKRNEKYFVNLKNAVFIEEFMGNNKIFKKFAAAAMIHEESKAIRLRGFFKGDARLKYDSIEFVDVMDQVFPPVANTLRELSQACNDYGNLAYTQVDNKLSKDFFNDMIATAKEHNLFDKDMYQAHLKLERYVAGLELINYIVLTEEIIPLIVDFLILKGKRVDASWQTSIDYEQQILKESLEKLEYKLSVYDNSKYIVYGEQPKDKDGYYTGVPRKLGLSQNQLKIARDSCRSKLLTYKSLIKYYESKTTAETN